LKKIVSAERQLQKDILAFDDKGKKERKKQYLKREHIRGRLQRRNRS